MHFVASTAPIIAFCLLEMGNVLSENYESYCYYVLTHYNHYGKIEKEGNFYHTIQRPKIHSKIEENSCDLIHADRNKKTVILMPPSSVKREVCCFPRPRLIFRFGVRVIYHSKGLLECIPKSISSDCWSVSLYHDLGTNSLPLLKS